MSLNLGDLFYNISADYKSVNMAIDKVEKLEKKVNKRPKPLDIAVNDNDVVDAGRKIDNLGGKTGRLEDKVKKSSEGIEKSFLNMKTAVIGVSVAMGALGLAAGKFAIDAGRPMEQAEARLNNMLKSTDAVNASMAILRQQAYETGNSVVTLSDNFSKMTVFVNSGQISLRDATDLSIGLDNALIALGGSSDNLGNIMYGLSQAMGSGIVRAEEFNQVMEPLPGLLNRVEQANGMASGSLRKMVNDGEVTSEMFKNMLIPALKSFQSEAEGMSNTLTVQQGRLSATFQAIGEDIYENIRDPLAASTAALDAFLQRFVSVQRAASSELKRRLEENQKERQKLASSGSVGIGMRSLAAASGARLGTTAATDTIKRERMLQLFKEEAELQNKILELENKSLPNINKSTSPAVKDASVIPDSKTATGGGNASKSSGNIKSKLDDRINLQRQYAQLEIDLIQDKFKKEQEIAEKKYSDRQALIEEFSQNGLINSQQRNELEAQNELDVTNRLLEIRREREERKLSLEREYANFKAETMQNDLERQLALEDLNYQARLEKLRGFLEQKIITEQEFKQLEMQEAENLRNIQNETRAKQEEKDRKKLEEEYKKNYLAKAAFAGKELKLAKFLSSQEADAAIGGMEKTLQAASATSKKAFELNKALSMGKAIIAGVEATMHAWKMGNQMGGPILGGAFAATSIAFSAAQVAAISSQSFQGGRMAGGNVSANSTYRVGENNRPEMLTIGGDSFLMTGNKGGMVTPNNKLGGGGSGGVVVTIVNQVQGVEFQQNNIDDNHIEIIAMRVVANEAPNIIGRELGNSNSRVSRSMQSNFKVDRRR